MKTLGMEKHKGYVFVPAGGPPVASEIKRLRHDHGAGRNPGRRSYRSLRYPECSHYGGSSERIARP